MQCIIYPDAQAGIAVTVPYLDCGLTLEQIARKDVPTGVAYRVIDDTDLPGDYAYQSAWEADFTSPDGYGADYGAGSDWAVVGYGDGTVLVRSVSTGEEMEVAQ